MIETEKVMPNGVKVTFWEFTHSETSAMAKWVMDCLCLPWIDNYPEFHDLLSDIFHRGSAGKDITQLMANQLANKLERFHEILPVFPKIKEGSRLVVPAHIHGEEATAWLIKEKSGIWYDQWENHPDIRRLGGFWKFPGAEPDEIYIKQQRQREERFWAEVDSRQTEYDCTRREAMLAVSDYMPRAESEYQLPDPRFDDM